MIPPARHDNAAPHASIAALVAGFASIYLIWGSTYIAIKFAVETLPPYLMAGTRFLTAGAILWLVLLLRGAAPKPTFAQFCAAAFIGMLLLAGSNGFVTWSVQVAPSSVAALIIGTVPLWMVLLDWILNRKPAPSLHVCLGVAIGFAGAALLAFSHTNGQADERPNDPMLRWAIAALLFACVLWAYGSLRSRRVDQGSSLMVASAMQMIGGGAAMLVLGTILGEWGKLDLSAVATRSIVSWAYLIIFGSLVGFTSYVWLLRVVSPTAVSTYAYVNPVVAVLLGVTLGNEPLTGMMILAGVMIVGAVILMTRRTKAVPAPKPGAAAPCEMIEEVPPPAPEEELEMASAEPARR